MFAVTAQEKKMKRMLAIDHILSSWISTHRWGFKQHFGKLSWQSATFLTKKIWLLSNTPSEKGLILLSWYIRRDTHHNSRLYTWSYKSTARQSRLDYRLLSENLDNSNIDVPKCLRLLSGLITSLILLNITPPTISSVSQILMELSLKTCVAWQAFKIVFLKVGNLAQVQLIVL